MTFTANSAGGKYLHKHDYEILYREYFGSVNTLHARKESSTFKDFGWNPPTKLSYQAGSQHLSANGATSSIDQYVLSGQTFYQSGVVFPYQTVYYWRRTA